MAVMYFRYSSMKMGWGTTMLKVGGIGVAAVIALAAYATNPGVLDHQREAAALTTGEMGSAVRSLNFGKIFDSLKSNVAGQPEYKNLIVMSLYEIKVDGIPQVSCFGFFTKVTCRGLNKPVATP